MPLSADYALSRYGGISYGVRGAASFSSTTGDAVTGGDAIAAIAAFRAPTSDAMVGGDGVSAIAAFASVTTDGVMGSDALGVSNNLVFSFLESAAGSDLLAAVTDFGIQYIERIMGLDAYIFSLFRPINIFALEQERRNTPSRAEMRAGITQAREPVRAISENRHSLTKTDDRNRTVKPDNRTFDA